MRSVHPVCRTPKTGLQCVRVARLCPLSWIWQSWMCSSGPVVPWTRPNGLRWLARRCCRTAKQHHGLGWNLDSYLGQERISHTGQYPGFRSEWERYPKQELSIVVLANRGSARVERLVPKIAGFYSPELVPPIFSAAAVPAARLFSVGKKGPSPWSQAVSLALLRIVSLSWRFGMRQTGPSTSKAARPRTS
jgi:hypothetical protein